MTQPNDSSRTPDRSSDGALDCATCSVVGLVAGLFLAAVAILLWTAISIPFD